MRVSFFVLTSWRRRPCLHNRVQVFDLRRRIDRSLPSWARGRADTGVGSVAGERIAGAVVDNHELCGVVLYRVQYETFTCNINWRTYSQRLALVPHYEARLTIGPVE